MNRYPHNRPSPLIAGAAVVATVATMALAVLLPAHTTVQPNVDSVLAKREARTADVTVTLERIDVIAARHGDVDGAAAALPVAAVGAKPRG